MWVLCVCSLGQELRKVVSRGLLDGWLWSVLKVVAKLHRTHQHPRISMSDTFVLVNAPLFTYLIRLGTHYGIFTKPFFLIFSNLPIIDKLWVVRRTNFGALGRDAEFVLSLCATIATVSS